LDGVVAVERRLIAVNVRRRHDAAEDVVPGPPQADLAGQAARPAHLPAEPLEVPVDRVIGVRLPVEGAARVELLQPPIQPAEQVNEGGPVIVAEALLRAALVVESQLDVIALYREERVAGAPILRLPAVENGVDERVTDVQPAAGGR